jgi:predicted nucleotidyltransferase
MKTRHNPLSADKIILPKGTRVVLRHRVEQDGLYAKSGSLGKVLSFDNRQYTVEFPNGGTFSVPRDYLKLQSKDLLDKLGQRQWEFSEFSEDVCLEVVVGSTAWGLSDENSDEDVRGVFVLPAEARAGLWEPPDEIHHPETDTAYWEIGKLMQQALRADANTLETLWSPIVKVETEIGSLLRDNRRIFLSKNVEGSFGRYALNQFQRIERDLQRNAMREKVVEAIEGGASNVATIVAYILVREPETAGGLEKYVYDVSRSAFDKGLTESRSLDGLVEAVRSGIDVLGRDSARYRPKNAYNLIRLLHSAIRILNGGEPMIEITDPDLKARLMAIKKGEVPIEETMAEARALGDVMQQAAENSTYDKAHEIMVTARRIKAIEWVS